jgi:hypothetical protein
MGQSRQHQSLSRNNNDDNNTALIHETEREENISRCDGIFITAAKVRRNIGRNKDKSLIIIIINSIIFRN